MHLIYAKDTCASWICPRRCKAISMSEQTVMKTRDDGPNRYPTCSVVICGFVVATTSTGRRHQLLAHTRSLRQRRWCPPAHQANGQRLRYLVRVPWRGGRLCFPRSWKRRRRAATTRTDYGVVVNLSVLLFIVCVCVLGFINLSIRVARLQWTLSRTLYVERDIESSAVCRERERERVDQGRRPAFFAPRWPLIRKEKQHASPFPPFCFAFSVLTLWRNKTQKLSSFFF